MKRFLAIAVAAMVIAATTVGWAQPTNMSPAPAPQTPPDDNHLIVPGQRIGPIKLGANIKDVMAVLGRPIDVADIISGEPIFIGWSSIQSSGGTPQFRPGRTLGTWVTLECNDPQTLNTPKCRILEIVVFDPDYATAEGLHVGVPEERVRNVLGEPDRVIKGGGVALGNENSHSLLYAAGILFSVNDDPRMPTGKVGQIDVRPRNCLKGDPCV